MKNYPGMMRTLDRMEEQQKRYVEECRRRGIKPVFTSDLVERHRLKAMEAKDPREAIEDEGEAP